MYTVIFGCGFVGMQALNFVGKDKVDFFCDNNTNFVGEMVAGKEVISYKKLLELKVKENVLIVLGLNETNADTVAEQLEKDEIYDFVMASLLPGFAQSRIMEDDIFETLKNKEGRMEYAVKYLKKRIIEEKEENAYLKKHANIHFMSPATGQLRKKQLDWLHRAEKALLFLKENCPVQCWLTCGGLLGKIRHNGFIPWDDDIDFGIMREDIYKLVDFFSQYSYAVFADEFSEDKIQEKYVLTIWKDFMRICIRENDKVEIALELFPYDFYEEDLTIEEYHRYVSDGFRLKRSLSNREWFDYFYNTMKHSKIVSNKPTNKILPGLDNFVYYGLWNIEEFVSYETVYPLKEISFEGVKLLSVNDEERYIKHIYPDWESFPNKIKVNEIE